MTITLAACITLLTVAVRQLICVYRGTWLSPWLGRRVTTACLITVLAGGCASNSAPKPDLESVKAIGVVLPEESTQTPHAKDFVQLYNRTKGEDIAKNTALGAGAGAMSGAAVGVAVSCMATACTGALFPAVAALLGGIGAVTGLTVGAIGGATVDSQEQVAVAPVHLHEVNKILPALQRDYLARTDLEARTLRLVSQENPSIYFVTVVPDGKRYTLGPGGVYTNVNLVLSELAVVLAGKAKDDPRLTLSVRTQWALTTYDASANLNNTSGIHAGSYESNKHPLSEWLAGEGALLRSQLDKGLEESLTSAFESLAVGTEKENWAYSLMDDSP